MKFVETHLTKHHLFHAPHKWFFAFLASPIHSAEMHYKKKYHLTFRHAKKLFVFDMTLLLSMFFLIAGSIFWFTYDPTVTDLVQLHITSTDTRLASGELRHVSIFIENNSSVSLIDSRLAVSFPTGFVLNESPPSVSHNTLPVGILAPGESRLYTYTGYLFAPPAIDQAITATLSYTQQEKTTEEVKVARIVSVVQDSLLQLRSNIPTQLVAGATIPIRIDLRNDSSLPLPVSLPLTFGDDLMLKKAGVSAGTVSTSSWDIPSLEPKEAVQLEGILETATRVNTARVILTPSLLINNDLIPQTTYEYPISIIHPGLRGNISISSTKVQPGDTLSAEIMVHNTGDSSLNDISLVLPIDTTIINRSAFASNNIGRFLRNDFSITKEHNAGLSHLPPGESRTLGLSLPIQSYISGEDISLVLSPRLTATIDSIATEITGPVTMDSAIAIGTTLSLDAESRYYTNEGDQLGRGPLPPQVGKETKYWAIIRIGNSSSHVRDVRLSATLPAGVVWTGRNSVSHGAPVQYDPNTRVVSWQLSDMWPGQQAGINAELSITPNTVAIGTHLPLLENMRITGVDSYIENDVSSSASAIYTDLRNDPLAQQSGTTVQ